MQANETLLSLGYETLPIKHGSKLPICRGWQKRTPKEMWKEAPLKTNIGIRGGGSVRTAIVDCDDKNCTGTFHNVQNWLAGLGIMPVGYPLVQTASGVGRHIYLSLEEKLEGSFRRISPSIGSGEFRYGEGSYVVAPPSEIVQEGIYELLNGDYGYLPNISIKDVLPILSNQQFNQTSNNLDVSRVTNPPGISRKALALLNGNYIDKYNSRSEAEQAVITSLINSGHDFSSVLRLFIKYPCTGKFKNLFNENPARAHDYLHHSYLNADKWSKSHESNARRTISTLISWAEESPWSGRTGISDRLVFLAHCQIAHRAGKIVYCASSRQLAEEAGCSSVGAINATLRLREKGLVVLEKLAVAELSNAYRFSAKLIHSLN